MKTIKQKKFPAKYTGTCRPCGEPIMAGEEIFYSKELGASHVRCSSAEVHIPELPAPADYAKPKKRRKYKKPEVQSGPAPRPRALEIVNLIEAAERAIPLLVRLGDFIGNGEDASKMERCDAIGALKDSIAAVNNAPSELMSYAMLHAFALRCYDLLTPEQQARAGDDLMRDLVDAEQDKLSGIAAPPQSRSPEGQAPSKANGASDGAHAPRVTDSAKRVRDRAPAREPEDCADCAAPLPSGGFSKMGESVRCAKCFEANWGHAPEREPGEEG